MAKFKVTFAYRGKVTVEVDAPTAEAAETNHEALLEADEIIAGALDVYDVTARPVRA